MKVALVGNFEPEHSTENHYVRAHRAMGNDVVEIQEGTVPWDTVDAVAADAGVDVIQWVHTHSLAPESTHDEQWAFLRRCTRRGIPTVATHLDRWWGLARQHQAETEPFFRCDLVLTADGGHDDDWARVGVEHVWLPPAVLGSECVPGTRHPEMASRVAFIGSWHGYHPEWPHRAELVAWLKRHHREDTQFWPKRGEHAVRGEALRDLYASVDILVGDSCLTGGATRYLSDRVPETLGRGGFLIHPRVEGVTDGALYTEGRHLACWDLGNWDELATIIDRYLDDDERDLIAKRGREHVLEHHTYETRVRQLAALLTERGLL